MLQNLVIKTIFFKRHKILFDWSEIEIFWVNRQKRELLFTRALCKLLLKYFSVEVSVSFRSLYVPNLAASNLWFNVSKARERFLNIAATNLLLSSVFLQFSIILTIQIWVMWSFVKLASNAENLLSMKLLVWVCIILSKIFDTWQSYSFISLSCYLFKK